MAHYKPSDDHWLSRMAAIEGRPEPEPVDLCIGCGVELDFFEDEDEMCKPCAMREGPIDDTRS